MKREKIKITIGDNRVEYKMNNTSYIEENENIWDEYGLIKDIDMLISNGKEHIKDYKTRHCHVEIETSAIIVENIIVPTVDEKEIANLVKFELERKLFINTDDFFIEYKKIDDNAVLVYLLPQENVLQIENFASALKLQIDVLDIIVSGDIQNINYLYEKNSIVKKKQNRILILSAIIAIVFICFIIVFVKNAREISILEDKINNSKTTSQKYNEDKDYEKLTYIKGKRQLINNIIEKKYIFELLTTIDKCVYDNNINLLSVKILDESITIIASTGNLKYITDFQNDMNKSQEKYLTHVYSIKKDIANSLYDVNISLIKEATENDIE